MPIVGDAVAGAIGGVAKPLFDLIDNLFTSDEERAEAKRKVLQMQQSGELAQIGVNLEEAKHRTIFVAGWRPFIGWTCGVALAYNFILRDLIQWGLIVWAPSIPVPPTLDFSQLLTVLLGMLGLGGMRTFEKYKGVSR